MARGPKTFAQLSVFFFFASRGRTRVFVPSDRRPVAAFSGLSVTGGPIGEEASLSLSDRHQAFEEGDDIAAQVRRVVAAFLDDYGGFA